jgi:hypothetical protein
VTTRRYRCRRQNIVTGRSAWSRARSLTISSPQVLHTMSPVLARPWPGKHTRDRTTQSTVGLRLEFERSLRAAPGVPTSPSASIRSNIFRSNCGNCFSSMPLKLKVDSAMDKAKNTPSSIAFSINERRTRPSGSTTRIERRTGQ